MTLEPTDAEQKLIAAERGGRVADYSLLWRNEILLKSRRNR